MDPRGVIQDVHTTGITYDHSSGMLSPDKCAELVSALHTDAPKGKGFYSSHIIDGKDGLIFSNNSYLSVFFRIQVLNSLQRDVSDPKNGLLTKHHDRPAILRPLHIQLVQRKFTTLINSTKTATIQLIIRYKVVNFTSLHCHDDVCQSYLIIPRINFPL